MEAIFLVCGAGGPQLKRNPLGGNAHSHGTKMPAEPPDIAHELLSQLSRVTPQEVVYHYTTQNGLLGVFQTKAIWCTDIRFLNDSTEMSFTVDFCRDLLERKLAKTTDARAALYDHWRRDLWTLEDYPTFVVSFSEDGDLLSQWRACSGSGGFAIGFLSSRLTTLASQYPLPARLIRCLYNVTEQGRYIEDAIERLGCDARAHHECTREFFRFILLAAAAFTHPKFSEEREWRLVVQALVGQVDEVGGVLRKFRPGSQTIVPYLPFPIGSDTDPFPIKVVVTGPGPAMQLSGQAIGQLMQQANLPPDALTDASQIPYRNW